MANLTAVIGADTSKFVDEVKSAQYMLNKFVNETKSAGEAVKKNTQVTNEQVAGYQRVLKSLEKVSSGTMTTQQQQKALADQIKELKVQWSNLTETAKSSDFGKSLSDTMRAAQDELKLLGEKVKAANVDLSSIGNVKVNQSLKRELRQLTTELQGLTNQYRNMDAAEKASAQGRELANKMDEIRAKAGELSDTIGDVSQEIKVMASDTPNLDAFNDLVGLGADALSTYSSILAKVTGDEKALKNAIATVMTVQSAANMLTKVTNALQSSSAIMLKTRAIQEGAAAVAIKIRTAAEGKGTVATKAATAAQAAFNLVAKANPYVLLATAVLGVATALITFSKNADEAANEQDELNDALEEGKRKTEEYKKVTQDTYANLMTSYSKLKNSWNQLKTEHEKNQWIKDNANELNNLQLSVIDVDSAEKVFNGNTDAVVQSFIARAKAAAKLAEMVDEYRKQMKLIDEISDISTAIQNDAAKSGRSAKRGDEIKDKTYQNSRYGQVNNQGKWTFHEQGAKLYSGTDVSSNPQLKAKEAELNASVAKTDRLAAEIASDASKVKKINHSSTSSKKTTTKVTEKPLEGSLDALKQEQNQIQEQLTKGKIKPNDIYDPKTNQTVAQRLAELPKLIQDTEISLGLKVDPKIENAENAKKKLQEEIDKLTKEFKNISFSPEISSFDKAIGKDNFNTKTLNGLQAQMDFNDSLLKQLESIKKKYEELGDTGSEAYDEVCNKIKETQGEQAKLGESAADLNKKQIEWEKQKKSMEDLSDTASALGSAFDGLGGIFSAVGDESAAAMMQIVATTADGIAQIIPQIMSLIGVKEGEAIASGTASASALPFPANIAAIASIVATVISTFASISSVISGSFANGGIIGGSTSIGDYNLARVNNGEMILNGRQQGNLFKAIDQNRLGGNGAIVGGDVKIKGSDLYIALKNYSKVQGTLGKNTGIK